MDTKIKIGVVIISDDGKVLLIKEKLSKSEPALWNIIKGSHEAGETTEDGALRECLEEVGLTAKLVASLGVYVSQKAEKIRIQFNFLAHAMNTQTTLAVNAEQESRGEAILEAKWFTKEEILSMNPNEFMSARTRELLNDWMEGKKFPLDMCKEVAM
jgi:ADP-ribose pyrophosphatase YjhB (NUDIX family)